MKILVVDDFATDRIIINSILKELGFENIVDVSNGYTALANLRSKIFNCVISGWEMSEMSGMELLKQIRTDRLLKSIPVLIVTEDVAIDNIVSATKAGASGFLLKPFKKENISVKLDEIYEKNFPHKFNKLK